MISIPTWLFIVLIIPFGVSITLIIIYGLAFLIASIVEKIKGKEKE